MAAIWRQPGIVSEGENLCIAHNWENVCLGFQYRKCRLEVCRGFTLESVADFCVGSSSDRGLRPSSVWGTSWHPRNLPPSLRCCVLTARNIRVPQLGFGSGQLLLANYVRPVSANFVDAIHWVLKGLMDEMHQTTKCATHAYVMVGEHEPEELGVTITGGIREHRRPSPATTKQWQHQQI